MLSSWDETISQSIVVVTTISTGLNESNRDDHGVKKFKKILLKAMDERFGSYEENEHYTLATFLDPRYRGYFFRKESTLPEVLSNLEEKVYEEMNRDILESTNSSTNSSGNSSDLDIFQKTMKGIIKKKNIDQTKKGKVMRDDIKDI